MKTKTEKQHDLAIRLPRKIFDGLHKVWANTPSEKTKYDIAALRDIAKRMGETATHDWLSKSSDRYGYALWYGCYVDEEYPGD